MKTEVFAWCDELLSAMANGVGAGIVVALFVGGGLQVFRGLNAATRHAVWTGALLFVAAVIPAQVWRPSLNSARSPGLVPGPEPVRMDAGLGVELADLPAAWPAAEGPSTPELSRSGPESFLAAPEVPTQVDRTKPQEAAGSPVAADSTAGQAWNAHHFGLEVPRWTGVGLVGVWFLVAGAKIALLLCRLCAIRQLKKSSLPVDGRLNDVFQRVRARLGVTRDVELRLSRGQHSALVLGFVHPVVLFPVEEGRVLDLEAAEQVMAHELAHVHRRDDWVNLIQQLMQAVLFFHPAVWWISRRLALEREIACDDFVLRQGGRPQAYALLLVNLAGRRLGDQRMLAPGVSAGKRQLQQRIAMILNANRNASPQLAKVKLGCLTAAAALAALAVLYSGPRLVLAGEAAEPVTDIDAAAQFAPAEREAPEDPAREPGIERPKIKPPVKVKFPGSDDPPAVAPAPVPVPAPAPRIAGVGPVVAVAPAAPQPVQAAATPRPARQARAAARDRSLEERLARLERMVESLVEKQQPQREPGEQPRPGAGFGRMEQQFEFAPDGRKLQAQIQREVDRAVEMQKRAMKDAEKAMKAAEKAIKLDKKPLEDLAMHEMRVEVEKQLEALQHQRQTLQREMEKISQQIERIRRENERTVEPKRRDSREKEAEEEEKSR